MVTPTCTYTVSYAGKLVSKGIVGRNFRMKRKVVFSAEFCTSLPLKIETRLTALNLREGAN